MPSIFKYVDSPSQLSIDRQDRYEARNAQKVHLIKDAFQPIEDGANGCIEIGAEEEVTTQTTEGEKNEGKNETNQTRCSMTVDTQTPVWPTFSAENFREDAKSLNHYTGLENYAKFQFVLQTLGGAAYHLKYFYSQVEQVTVEDQFFIVLMRLRKHETYFELSRLFGISEYTVTNIFITWINFMYRQWKEINIWSSKDLVQYHAPSDFKRKFPSTRAIVDGTECPIKKPKNPTEQQQTFSHYKNKNTVKVLVSATPGGMVCDVTDAYGGAASDRQIVERSNMPEKCDPKDSLMADKGFNVQDIFAPFDVQINIPNFFSKKNRMSGDTVLKDRKIASKRVHIERIIGLGKTYKILDRRMNATETKMASKIIFVCYMLCNFKRNIVPKDA